MQTSFHDTRQKCFILRHSSSAPSTYLIRSLWRVQLVGPRAKMLLLYCQMTRVFHSNRLIRIQWISYEIQSNLDLRAVKRRNFKHDLKKKKIKNCFNIIILNNPASEERISD